MVILEWVQQRARKVIKNCSIWHLKRSLEPGLFNPEKRSLLGSLIKVYKYLMGTGWDGSVIASGRTRGNGHRNKHKNYHLNKWKTFSTVRVVRHWTRLFGEVVLISKTWLGLARESCSGWPWLELGAGCPGIPPSSSTLGSAIWMALSHIILTHTIWKVGPAARHWREKWSLLHSWSCRLIWWHAKYVLIYHLLQSNTVAMV